LIGFDAQRGYYLASSLDIGLACHAAFGTEVDGGQVYERLRKVRRVMAQDHTVPQMANLAVMELLRGLPGRDRLAPDADGRLSALSRILARDPFGAESAARKALWSAWTLADMQAADNPDEPHDPHSGRWVLDVNKAAQYLKDHLVLPGGEGACARHVREALASAGVFVEGERLAKNWGPKLEKARFQKIEDENYKPKDGDIAITVSGHGVSESGHVAMYYKGQWYSDLITDQPEPSKDAKTQGAKVVYYRYPNIK
jgi:hypothetical protein